MATVSIRHLTFSDLVRYAHDVGPLIATLHLVPTLAAADGHELSPAWPTLALSSSTLRTHFLAYGRHYLVSSGRWWTAFTSMFLHAQADHLANNTIGILFANSLIFLFTYALRSREKAIITANLAAIRDDMQRHQESLAGLLASQERLGEMHGHLTEATSKASDLRAGNGGVAAGLAPFIAKPDSQSEKLEPDPSTTAGHSEGTLVADSVQATASQQQRRKTMLAWYVGVACLCSWALGRCMPNTG